jgi:GNAT superfamily N-acetyltransferase
MSLYADYVRERLGWETIEVESGFITYAIRPPNASVEEFYVDPTQRGTSLAKRLVDQVVIRAREAGAKYLWSAVVPGTAGADSAMLLNLKYGFKLHSTTVDGRVQLVMNLED